MMRIIVSLKNPAQCGGRRQTACSLTLTSPEVERLLDAIRDDAKLSQLYGKLMEVYVK